jgi:hypothetical protein
VTGGAFSSKMSQAAVAGPAAAAAVVVTVGPAAAAAAGMVAVATPGVVVEAAAAVVDAAAKTAASPQASPADTGVAAMVVEPGSYSAPSTKLSSGPWQPAPPRRIHHRGGASATCPPCGPGCSVW